MDYSILPSNWSCMIIDGDLGAGKTSLAKEIARDLKADVVSLDDHLSGDREKCYWDRIDSEALRKEIFPSRPKVIIEGVCALKILAAINARHDFHMGLS